jgi:two-component system sensor histidine kinase/response regulator
MEGVVPDRRLAGETLDLHPEMAKDEQTRAFLASIVESSDDSIIGTDLEGTILSWNGGAERLWGYSAAEAIGRHITMLFPPGRHDDYLRSLDKVQRHERFDRFESIRVRKDGAPINVSAILSPIRDDRGQLRGVSAIYTDITKQKQADEELLKAKEAAEAASRTKSEFLANMSHEIRTPMNGILGMLEVALEMELDAELRDYLETAQTSASTLLVILNDILDFSKIEAGRLELEETNFSVPAIVYEAVSTLAVVAQRKGLTLRHGIGPGIPLVLLGDPTRMRQVLVNLVNNAIKFTDQGFVEVRVDARRVDSRAAVVEFSVIDTGIGMSEEQKDVIFEAFRQADGSTTRRFGGTGLGLSISHRLAALMGGELWVDSQPGQGSTFHFRLQLKQPEIPGPRT